MSVKSVVLILLVPASLKNSEWVKMVHISLHVGITWLFAYFLL